MNRLLLFPFAALVFLTTLHAEPVKTHPRILFHASGPALALSMAFTAKANS